MASLLSATRQALLPACRRQLHATASTSLLVQRGLHASAVSYKKIKLTPAQRQEMVGVEFDDSEIRWAASLESPTSDRTHNLRRGKLAPEKRTAKFEEIFAFVKAHIGKNPASTDPKQVRNSAWTHLFQLAADEPQLRRVADMFADYITVNRKFKDQQVLLFVQRCHDLKCPDLAVEVFSNRPYYRLDIVNVATARELLHNALKEDSFKQAITISTLYTLYNLPPLAKDIVSCSMLLCQCLGVDTPDARTIAGALLPAFRKVVEETPSLAAAQVAICGSGHPRDAKPLTWLRNAAGTIDNRLSARGEDMGWLRQWRINNGHLPSKRPLEETKRYRKYLARRAATEAGIQKKLKRAEAEVAAAQAQAQAA